MANENPERRVIAGAARDPFHPVFMGMLRPLDATLLSRGAGKGLWLYDEVERDCHAFSVLQKRKMAVVSFPWDLAAGGTKLRDRQAVKIIKPILEELGLAALCVGLLDAVLKGYSVGEVLWDPATWLPTSVIMRDQRRFLFDVDSKPRLITRENMFPGEELPDRKFIVHRFGSQRGDPYGLGLGSKLFWPTWFKRKGISFWLVFAEKFGSPTVIGKYPTGMPIAEQEELLATLGNLAQETALVAPLETEVTLLEAARSGSVDSYERLIRYMDEEISKTTLGETLTTTIGQSGAYAASKTHNEVRLELVRADADMLAKTLNSSLIQWLTDLHCPGAVAPKIFWEIKEPEDLLNEAKKDQTVASLGFEPTEEYIRSKYGEGWNKKKGAPNPPPMLGGTPMPGSAAPVNEPDPAFAEGADDPVDGLASQLEAGTAKAMGKLLEPVRRLVKDAKSLEAIRDGLLDLYPQMDNAAFAEILTQAFLAADLAGRALVSTETREPVR